MTTLTFAADESGDVSFSFTKGASRHFVVAAVATPEPEHLRNVLASVRHASRLDDGFEFRLNTLSSRTLRLRVYQALAAAEFESWAVVVDKERLSDPFRLLSGPDVYAFFLTELIAAIPFALRGEGTLILDQFGSPGATRSEIKRVLRMREIELGFRHIQIARSRSEPLVQVADLIAGAIMRRARGDEAMFRWVEHHCRSVVQYGE